MVPQYGGTYKIYQIVRFFRALVSAAKKDRRDGWKQNAV
jgi:hypothetical protein